MSCEGVAQAFAAGTVSSGSKAPWKSLPEVIETSRVPVMLYADRQSVEPEAIQQLIKLAESPMPVSEYSFSCFPSAVAQHRSNFTVLPTLFEPVCQFVLMNCAAILADGQDELPLQRPLTRPACMQAKSLPL